MRMSVADWTTRILVIVGGLNWGLIGLSRFNLVAALFGEGTSASRVVYSLVGLSALYQLIRLLFGETATNREDVRE